MGKSHKEQIELKAELEQAQDQIEVGAQYRHYKAASNIYTVLTLHFKKKIMSFVLYIKQNMKSTLHLSAL